MFSVWLLPELQMQFCMHLQLLLWFSQLPTIILNSNNNSKGLDDDLSRTTVSLMSNENPTIPLMMRYDCSTAIDSSILRRFRSEANRHACKMGSGLLKLFFPLLWLRCPWLWLQSLRSFLSQNQLFQAPCVSPLQQHHGFSQVSPQRTSLYQQRMEQNLNF
jgi:hypothetical protein